MQEEGRSLTYCAQRLMNLCTQNNQNWGQAFKHTYLHFDNESEDEANAISGELVNAYSEVMGHERIYESA